MIPDPLKRRYEEDLKLYDRLEDLQSCAADLAGVSSVPLSFGAQLPVVSSVDRGYFEGIFEEQKRLIAEQATLVSKLRFLPRGAIPGKTGAKRRWLKEKVFGWGGPIGGAIAGAAGGIFRSEEQQKIERSIKDLEERIALLKMEQQKLEAERQKWTPHQRDLARSVCLDKAKEQGRPAKPVIEKHWQAAAHRFENRTRQESMLGAGDDYQDVLRSQVCEWEQLIRSIIMGDADALADTVLAGLKQGPRQLLDEHLVSGNPHTLFVIEQWIVGLRRQLASKDAQAITWMKETFRISTTRFQQEHLNSIEVFSRGPDNLGHFISQLRTNYRNPLAHGLKEPVNRESYRGWCDLSYGTENLHQWMEVGVAPVYYQPRSFGWLSFLSFSLKA